MKKTLRILAIVPLALISLMDVGAPTGGTDMNLAASIAVVAMGVAGLAAVVGVAWNKAWGIPAALTMAGVNMVGGIVAVVADSEGAVIGLTVSTLALVFAALAAGSLRRAPSAA